MDKVDTPESKRKHIMHIVGLSMEESYNTGKKETRGAATKILKQTTKNKLLRKDREFMLVFHGNTPMGYYEMELEKGEVVGRPYISPSYRRLGITIQMIQTISGNLLEYPHPKKGGG